LRKNRLEFDKLKRESNIQSNKNHSKKASLQISTNISLPNNIVEKMCQEVLDKENPDLNRVEESMMSVPQIREKKDKDFELVSFSS